MAINIVVKTNPCDILGFISHDIPLYPQLLLFFYTAILVGENLHFWAYPNQFLLVKSTCGNPFGHFTWPWKFGKSQCLKILYKSSN